VSPALEPGDGVVERTMGTGDCDEVDKTHKVAITVLYERDGTGAWLTGGAE
jgi:hypothetical protein